MSTQGIVRVSKEKLTLDHNVLTGLFVMLTTAADPIGKTVALIVECLTPLACQDTHHQLVLNLRDQYLGQLALGKETKTHFDEDLPPAAHRPSPYPQPLVQGMLDVVRPMHLRDDLPRGREFSVGDPNFGFAIAGSEGSRESRGRHYHSLFDYSSRGNPCPRNLEGL